jgi:hypothetical protein
VGDVTVHKARVGEFIDPLFFITLRLENLIANFFWCCRNVKMQPKHELTENYNFFDSSLTWKRCFKHLWMEIFLRFILIFSFEHHKKTKSMFDMSDAKWFSVGEKLLGIEWKLSCFVVIETIIFDFWHLKQLEKNWFFISKSFTHDSNETF